MGRNVCVLKHSCVNITALHQCCSRLLEKQGFATGEAPSCCPGLVPGHCQERCLPLVTELGKLCPSHTCSPLHQRRCTCVNEGHHPCLATSSSELGTQHACSTPSRWPAWRSGTCLYPKRVVQGEGSFVERSGCFSG